MQIIENNEGMVNALKNELTETIHFLDSKGWAPAGSSNFSFRVPGENKYWISANGVNKSSLRSSDFMLIDVQGEPPENTEIKPPSGTLLHSLLYENPDINVVLHTYSISSTVISMAHKTEGEIKLSGYELLKGLSGVNTHDTTITVPVFANMQDIKRISLELRRYMRGRPDFRAFLLSGNGLYAWGKTMAEAKRHIEVFEFLLECEINLKIYKAVMKS